MEGFSVWCGRARRGAFESRRDGPKTVFSQSLHTAPIKTAHFHAVLFFLLSFLFLVAVNGLTIAPIHQTQ